MMDQTRRNQWVIGGILILILGGILSSHLNKEKGTSGENLTGVQVRESEVGADEDFASLRGYYPDDPQDLRQKLDLLLNTRNKKELKGEPVGMIVPHAALDYSGEVAASAYRQLKGKNFDTVVLLVPNHHAVSLDGIVICPKGKWKTPLGSVKVNSSLARKLKNQSSEFVFNAKAFEKEHSLEVQLPFLQTALGEFEILPVMIGGRSSERSSRLADALYQLAGEEKVLFLATTHLSREESAETGKRLDFLATSALEQCDTGKMRRYEQEGLLRLCGYTPMMALLEFLKMRGIEEGVLLEYSNSAEADDEDKGIIVGYAALVYTDKS